MGLDKGQILSIHNDILRSIAEMTNRLDAGSSRMTYPPEHDGITSLAMHRNDVPGRGSRSESQRSEII